MSCTENSDDSGRGQNTLPEICSRYQQASFEVALHRSLDYKRASSELADLYVLASTATDTRISKMVMDMLYQDTMTAISCCDG